MRNLIVLCAATLALVACTTPEQKAAEMQAEVNNMMVMYGPACSKLGYVASSDPWRNCVLQLSAKDDADRYQSYYAGYAHSRWAMGGRFGPYY